MDFIGNEEAANSAFLTINTSSTVAGLTLNHLIVNGSIFATCCRFYNSTVSQVSQNDEVPEIQEDPSLGETAENAVIFLRTALGLTIVSGFCLGVVLLLLLYSMYQGCCKEGGQRPTSVMDMPDLWSKRLQNWQKKQKSSKCMGFDVSCSFICIIIASFTY